MVTEAGYEFFANRKLVTIFSAPNYMQAYENDGCLMKVSEELTCGFLILKPRKIPEFKMCVFTSFEIGDPKSHFFIKNYLSSKPEIRDGCDEHKMSLKTN